MYNPIMTITFIQTGGTIDKDYPAGDNNHGYSFEITTPAVKRILEKIKPLDFDYEVIECLKKDSLDITDDDRKKIKETCLEIENDKIIITHGTDTMNQTAKFLGDITGKTIILTGAMRPEKFTDSDADFNVGVAIGALYGLDNGVYVAMNGQIKPVTNL